MTLFEGARMSEIEAKRKRTTRKYLNNLGTATLSDLQAAGYNLDYGAEMQFNAIGWTRPPRIGNCPVSFRNHGSRMNLVSNIETQPVQRGHS